MQTREEAYSILTEYTKSESLLKHSLSVEACMEWYAKHFKKNDDEVEKWKITGLLHDFDYEAYPEPAAPDGHPYKGNAILKEKGYDDEICTAIMGHAEYTGVKRETQLAKTLFAVDELSGLITACVLVRPDKSIIDLKLKSVKKKLKDKAFARGCNRDDIKNGALEIEIELDTHIENVIQAMTLKAKELGLA